MRILGAPVPLNFLLVSTIALSACNGFNTGNKDKIPQNENSPLTHGSLSLISSIKLDNVKGGFDLMDLDATGQRLFLAAEDNHTLEVIDLKNSKPLISIPNLNEPKWIVYRPETNRLYVSTAGDAKVTLLDATSYKPLRFYSFKEKCNNLRFDTATKQLYVGVGKSFGALAIINCKEDKIRGEIPLTNFPKQFELDSNRIYVNIPSKNAVEVIDRLTNKVLTEWQVTESTENVPMALDKINHRLFVACEPGKFIVFNTENGKSVSNISIHKNADGIYFNRKDSLIYISCGEGFIDIIRQRNADSYYVADDKPTAIGAGTSLYSPELKRLFLAVPQREKEAAELRIYAIDK
ncbi:YncE family protein [Parafilimonas sp.]|uniref:YncE family protein n=1 Tax=Parafilimonas sp. TaxID=1969739 RepID=UPI003F7F4865